MSCAFGPAVVAAFVFAIGNGNKDNVDFNRDLLTNRSPISYSYCQYCTFWCRCRFTLEYFDLKKLGEFGR